MILFLTDGIDCSVHPKLRCPTDKYDEEVGPTNTEHVRDGVRSILDLIDRRQQQLQDAGGSGTPARIFTFSMTEDADDRLPKLIACSNGGSWSSIHGELAFGMVSQRSESISSGEQVNAIQYKSIQGRFSVEKRSSQSKNCSCIVSV